MTWRPSTRSGLPCTALAMALAASACGCGSNKLETGYAYTPLNSTPSQRRAYYAGPFSPEARAARQRDDPNATNADRHARPGM